MSDIFFSALSGSLSKYDRLSAHEQLIDWLEIGKLLKDSKVRLRISYEPLLMLGALYLARLHSLDCP